MEGATINKTKPAAEARAATAAVRASKAAERKAAKEEEAAAAKVGGETQPGRFHIEYRAVREDKWLLYGGRGKARTAVGWIAKRSTPEEAAKYRVVDSETHKVLHMGDGSVTYVEPAA